MDEYKVHPIPLSIDHQCINYGNQVIHYQVCYLSDRKHNVAIHVHPNGSVQVDVPEHTAAVDIKKAVLKRARWVIKHLSQIDEQKRHTLPREYVSGETHFYLGRRYQLKVIDHEAELVKMLGGKLVIHSQDKSAAHAKALLWLWYRNRSEKVFGKRLNAMAAELPWTRKKAPRWKLLKMKKQWGSCSPKGLLSINPHLIKAPRDCIDYVLLHELCHLQEHNHSKQFYKLLDRHMPDWTSRKAKLDGMAELLINE